MPVISAPVAEDLVPVQNQGTIVNSQRITLAAGLTSLLQTVTFPQNLALRIEAVAFTLVPLPAVDYVELDIVMPDQRHVGGDTMYFALRALGQNGLPLVSPGGGWLIPANKLVQYTLRNLYTEPIACQLHFHCSRYDAARLIAEGYLSPGAPSMST